MISVKVDDDIFFSEMNNVLGYAKGFLEGVERGKAEFYHSIAKDAINIFKEFVDQQARVDPYMYHHIYEWYRQGSPDSRLFDIEYTVGNGGLTFNGVLTQSKSIKNGSNVPFYNKATIMEKGIPVTIKPNKKALKFNVGSEEVFVSGPITVDHPGGTRVTGAFENIFKIFFEQNFRQSVLDVTGITRYLSNPTAFKYNFSSSKVGGKAKGIEVGYNWIKNAGGLSV